MRGTSRINGRSFVHATRLRYVVALVAAITLGLFSFSTSVKADQLLDYKYTSCSGPHTCQVTVAGGTNGQYYVIFDTTSGPVRSDNYQCYTNCTFYVYYGVPTGHTVTAVSLYNTSNGTGFIYDTSCVDRLTPVHR